MPSPPDRELTLTCQNCHEQMVVAVPTDADSLLDFSLQAAALTERYERLAEGAVKALQVAERRIRELESTRA